MLDRSAADRASSAARNALITCALAFGRRGGGEHEVLFAVARSYTAAARARYRDERLASDVVQVDDGRIVRRLLGQAEDTLCHAAKAAACAQHLDVGRQVLVRGRLRTRSWTNHQGVQRWSTEVLADRVIFLGGAAKRTSEPGEQVEPPPPEDAPAGAEDDIPF